MKKLCMICAIVSVFAACKSKTVDTKDVTGLDTTLMYKNNVYSDTAVTQTSATVPAATKPQSNYPKRSAGSRSTPVATQANSGAQAQTTQKKGWSHSAKDAVIGGVGGAVAGAVISKKKGKGAVIGGAVGAAGGYIIGRKKDKKEGRVQ